MIVRNGVDDTDITEMKEAKYCMTAIPEEGKPEWMLQR